MSHLIIHKFLYSLSLRETCQRAIVLVAPIGILHARVYDGTHGHIDIIGAEILQQLNDLVALGPEVVLGERAVVGDANAFAAGAIFRCHMIEPGRLAEGASLCNAETRQTKLICGRGEGRETVKGLL